jgi:hypothetical protein
MQEEINESRALIFNKLKVIQRSFNTWTLFFKENKLAVSHEQMAIAHFTKTICAPVFNKWKSVSSNLS